ncbi:hypothetical protein [Cupriavidus sp. TMH.W2]|uniref:hypothetical protein n=1 Tax=Cupriavidus sp. TMH.W2 TaxID=3434465 RepID=UPI003D787E4F
MDQTEQAVLGALGAFLLASHSDLSVDDIRPTSTRGLWVVVKPCGGMPGGCRSKAHEYLEEGKSCVRQITFRDAPLEGVPYFSQHASWREHRRLLGMNPAHVFKAKLKTRKEMERDIPPIALGWWHDVCPGETLHLRDATSADLARCMLRDGTSREPADYLCELPEDGSLVSKLAIKHLEEVPLEDVL